MAGIEHTTNDGFNTQMLMNVAHLGKKRSLDTINSPEPAVAYFIQKEHLYGKKIKFCGWYPDYRHTAFKK